MSFETSRKPRFPVCTTTEGRTLVTGGGGGTIISRGFFLFHESFALHWVLISISRGSFFFLRSTFAPPQCEALEAPLIAGNAVHEMFVSSRSPSESPDARDERAPSFLAGVASPRVSVSMWRTQSVLWGSEVGGVVVSRMICVGDPGPCVYLRSIQERWSVIAPVFSTLSHAFPHQPISFLPDRKRAREREKRERDNPHLDKSFSTINRK